MLFLVSTSSRKALKTLLLHKNYDLIKTHDLVLLARKLEAPEYIIQYCKELTPVYVETRYPDLGEEGFKKFSKKETEEDLKRMREIIEWIKKNL